MVNTANGPVAMKTCPIGTSRYDVNNQCYPDCDDNETNFPNCSAKPGYVKLKKWFCSI